MPRTEVYFYKDADGTVPVLDWFAELQRTERRAFAKCRVAVERLAALGYELRRPEVDYLEDGIYELRVRFRRVNYRVLYFYCGRNVTLLAHGLTKERDVPRGDLDRALRRKAAYERSPEAHTHEQEL